MRTNPYNYDFVVVQRVLAERASIGADAMQSLTEDERREWENYQNHKCWQRVCAGIYSRPIQNAELSSAW